MKALLFRTLLVGPMALVSALPFASMDVQAQGPQRVVVGAQSPRDAFVGHWTKYGGDFFPDEIVFEPDPASADKVLVSFKLACQYQTPACSAVKVRSSPVSGGMVSVEWYKDAAGTTYNARFMIVPANAKLVKQAEKEASAFFTVNPTFNRTAYIAGTNENELRYYVTLSAAKPATIAPQQRREMLPK